MSRKKAKRLLDDIIRCDEALANAVAEYKRAKRDKR